MQRLLNLSYCIALAAITIFILIGSYATMSFGLALHLLPVIATVASSLAITLVWVWMILEQQIDTMQVFGSAPHRVLAHLVVLMLATQLISYVPYAIIRSFSTNAWINIAIFLTGSSIIVLISRSPWAHSVSRMIFLISTFCVFLILSFLAV